MVYYLKQLINGDWLEASNGATWQLVNPATEAVLQELPFGAAEDCQKAIDAAHQAFQSWSKTTPYERADILLKAGDWILERVDELAVMTTEESGKPLSESAAEWRSATNYIKWFAEESKRAYGRTIPARIATRRIMVNKQPLGVVATITAWNFPVYNIVRSWAAALAAGCTVVGRPSEFTPRSGMLLAQAFYEAGVPAGVINLINGDAEQMAQVMLNDPRCRKISFTGSTRVGKLLMEGASRTVTRLALELGGNAPFIVFPDVNVQEIAEQAVTWKYRNCGQVCVAPQRFFVHTDIVEEFTGRVTELSRNLALGDGLDQSVNVGPLINANQRQRVSELVTESVALGAEVYTGAKRPDGLSKGYFYEPTVLGNIKPDMPVYNQEIFGPVMPIIPFSDTREVIDMANDTEYGLTAFVYTKDLNLAFSVSEALEYGMVAVNDWLPATPEAPFGGVKQSGIGRECGQEGLEDYLETKTVFFGGIGLS
ncbi:NAD-dependent succinate-semialdehyde dehydrogenase [Anaerolineales bacterium]